MAYRILADGQERIAAGDYAGGGGFEMRLGPGAYRIHLTLASEEKGESFRIDLAAGEERSATFDITRPR